MREASRVPQDRPDSRDSQGPQALQVKVENQVTRVFPERLELQVWLAPEVNVASPVNVDLQVPKACRVPEGCLALLVLMGPRVQLVLLAPLDLKDPQVFRGCLVREEQLVFLDQRETGVMLVRRVQRAHLGRMVAEV